MKRTLFELCLSVLALALLSDPARAGVVYVDVTATGTGNGTSWANAFTSLPPALAAAQAGDELWVARGSYAPAPPGGPRTASFELKSGVAVYGGFAGGETQLSARDVLQNPTLLSGDLAGDDGPGFANDGENSFHVVHCAITGAAAILDGFTVHGGNATPGADGGGVLHESGSATYAQLAVRDNRAVEGGGMAYVAGHVTLVGCTFLRNLAVSGGGLSAAQNDLHLDRCLFAGNTATFVGGGFHDGYGGEYFSNCIFSGNTAALGGAVYESDSFTAYSNCTFSRNHATTYGGGIKSDGVLGSTVKNCILWGNTGATGSVLENQDDAIGSTGSALGCTVQGHPGTSLADMNGLDPWLADPLGADGLAGTLDDDLRLQPGSICVDASRAPAISAPLDFAGLPRAVDDPNTPLPSPAFNTVVDRGAHEYQPCPAPTIYCATSPNSAGPGSLIGCTGTASVHFDNLVLRSTGNPPNAVGIFIYGQVAAANPLGNGLLCLGGGVRRLPQAPADAQGVAQFALDVHAPPGLIDPGEEWGFQYWYRNPAGGGAGFNLSDGLRVLFCP